MYDQKTKTIAHVDGYCAGRYGKRTPSEAPSQYFERTLNQKITRQTGWAMVKCPFHDDRHSSLSINIEHGGFVCHACGAKGGNVAAFEAKLKGITYREALSLLGGH